MNLRPRSQPAATASDIDADEVVDISLSGGRVHIDVVIPRTGIKAKLRIVARSEVSAIRAETRAFLIAAGFPVDAAAVSALGALDEWNAEIAVRHLQVAVRSAADTDLELADLESWRECDDDQIAFLWGAYQDLEFRQNPLALPEKLDEARVIAIREAAKKKDADLLLSFGSRELALFLITSAAPPAT